MIPKHTNLKALKRSLQKDCLPLQVRLFVYITYKIYYVCGWKFLGELGENEMSVNDKSIDESYEGDETTHLVSYVT